MGALSLRIPRSIHEKIKSLAKLERVSINQFVNSALAEKLAVFFSDDYLSERARRGERARYLKTLSKVKTAQPMPGDEI